MLTATHLVTAQTAYLGACFAAAHPPAPSEALVALIGALLPDLDSHNSYFGRFLAPLSGWIEHQFGHSTLTHSLLAQIAGGLVAWWPGGCCRKATPWPRSPVGCLTAWPT